MTTFESRLTPPVLPSPSGDRRDLLGIANSHVLNRNATDSADRNLQHLEALGFEVCRAGRRHWVICRRGTQTRIHLYGATELALFVNLRAHQYATLYTGRHST